MHHKWTHVDTYIAQIKTRVGDRHEEIHILCLKTEGNDSKLWKE